MSVSLPLPDDCNSLPPVLVGPLLRRLEPARLVMWLVGSRALSLTLRLQNCADIRLDAGQCTVIPIGTHAFIHLIDVPLATALPCDTLIEYDLLIDDAMTGIAEWAPHLLYGEARCPNFVLRSRIDQLLHGSCRKPHYPATDGLLCVDRLLAEEHDASQRPALLMMSGDQVYADDVAGPMLRAIHALIERLGLFEEHLEGAVVSDSAKLYEHPASYYHRADLLPALKSNETLRDRFFGGASKPIFTSSSADNHLMTFAEVMAMYLLVWSPTPWTLINPQPPALTLARHKLYAEEQTYIDDFQSGLGGAARAMAHLPCLMIFDDHDITDDWNLSAQWEETAYGHPFSKRIIGNALIAYMLCQGWGNNPDAFGDVLEKTRLLSATGGDRYLDSPVQDDLIDDAVEISAVAIRAAHHARTGGDRYPHPALAQRDEPQATVGPAGLGSPLRTATGTAGSPVGDHRFTGADLRRQTDRNRAESLQLVRLSPAGGRRKLDGPSRRGPSDPEHFPTLAHAG